jgi:hypothetical protein
MIDVKNKICEMDGCTLLSSCNIPGALNTRFCASHKQVGMIDIKSKKCIIDNCNTISTCGFLGKGKTHCSTHKQKGMIRLPNSLCKIPKCRELGVYELHSTRFCEDHVPDGAQNLGLAKCISCGLDDIITNGKCATCDPINSIRIHHAKENRIRDILLANNIQFIHDKMLEGPICGRERPDFQIDCGSHFVYIEVDEHQHESYACECEQTRMINLAHVRQTPVHFIRYNPDLYEPVKGQKYVIVEKRERKLIEYVKYAMKHSPTENKIIADVLYLFYDNYDTTKIEWNTLL